MEMWPRTRHKNIAIGTPMIPEVAQATPKLPGTSTKHHLHPSGEIRTEASHSSGQQCKYMVLGLACQRWHTWFAHAKQKSIFLAAVPASAVGQVLIVAGLPGVP